MAPHLMGKYVRAKATADQLKTASTASDPMSRR